MAGPLDPRPGRSVLREMCGAMSEPAGLGLDEVLERGGGTSADANLQRPATGGRNLSSDYDVVVLEGFVTRDITTSI
jgi:hypothetical protein